ncbi:hypothetical protein E1193_07425 [Micromonospora sp. KC606]|uniref:hypothetical protein n=1 Tax=Micromonospora sp. KC606 TaxID=2530379 RepID=UPI00104C9EAA|nr:hypothetical protein [Micromonospora sp. KC606]TDC83898.1 hypothetical protein E1193_07425 [Micromonospora sp. KC606]
MKKPISAGIAGAFVLAAGLLTAAPAQAATCAEDTACDTTTTFDVTAGALEITVPDTADLGNDATPGGYAYGSLGPVTVSDERASLTPTWTATVTGTDFTTGGATTPETIPNSSIYYFSGNATATTGDGTFTPGQAGAFAPPPPPVGETLDLSRTAFSHSGGTGNNSATWNPSLTAQVALNKVAGTYTGTISHTVT